MFLDKLTNANCADLFLCVISQQILRFISCSIDQLTLARDFGYPNE